MAEEEKRFDKIWKRMVEHTNAYVKKNPETTMYGSFGNDVEKFADYLILSGAWLYDRHNGKMPKDRGSMTKKVRKALGFTYP